MQKLPKIQEDQPSETTPKGLTVPVPDRDSFFGNLKKAAKPEKESGDSSPADSATE